MDVVDPCMHSIQWSRRAIGLKVFLSLAVPVGRPTPRPSAIWWPWARCCGSTEASGWQVVNETPLPLCCFIDERHADGRSAAYLHAVP